MGRVMKRAIVTSKSVIPEENRATLDAILTGTGLGSVEDTEKFLNALLKNDEEIQNFIPTTSSLELISNILMR